MAIPAACVGPESKVPSSSLVTPSSISDTVTVIAPIDPLQSFAMPNPSPSPTTPLTQNVSNVSEDNPKSQAPDFKISLINGEILRLSDLKGKVVVLNFWASWCPPCRWEMPAFERIWQEYREQDVIFLGVAMLDQEDTVRDFIDKVGVTYPIGLDTSGQIQKAYRVLVMPTTYFIDRHGYISRILSGAANEAVLQIYLDGQVGTE